MISTVCAIVACATTLIAQDTVCRLSGSIPDESFNGKKYISSTSTTTSRSTAP